MDREQELELLDRCLAGHREQRTTEGEGGSLAASRYLSEARFAAEMEHLFRVVPAAQVHSSEIREPNSFRRVATTLGDLVVTRDAEGGVHSFHNACRHRGNTLVHDGAGCRRRLTCGYHAWSYSLDGALAAVPAEDPCFPGLDKSKLALREIPCIEKYGFIWTCPGASDPGDAERRLDAHLGGLREDLVSVGIDRLQVFLSRTRTWQANWKILVEGGLETYHFKVAHRNTIASHFLDNVAVVDEVGGHFRVTIPSTAIAAVPDQPRGQRRVRDCTHINYQFTGSCGLLVQEEHVDWFRARPLSPGRTELTITSLIPDDVDALSPGRASHWGKNFEITEDVLIEDFRIGEGIQRGFESGAVETVRFGRHEWALPAFHRVVDGHCGLE